MNIKVIKSKHANQCAGCDGAIAPGEDVSPWDEVTNERRGWGHAECVQKLAQENIAQKWTAPTEQDFGTSCTHGQRIKVKDEGRTFLMCALPSGHQHYCLPMEETVSGIRLARMGFDPYGIPPIKRCLDCTFAMDSTGHDVTCVDPKPPFEHRAVTRLTKIVCPRCEKASWPGLTKVPDEHLQICPAADG